MSKDFPPRLVVSTRVLRQLLFATDALDAVCRMLPGTDIFVAESSWTTVDSWISRSADAHKLKHDVAQELRDTAAALSDLVAVIPEQFIRPYYSAIPTAPRHEQVLQSCALAWMLDAPVWVERETYPKIDAVKLWTLSSGFDA